MTTILSIIIAAIIATCIALYQYGYILSNPKTIKRPWFALIRAITVFLIALLIIDLSWDKTTYQTIKPLLIIAVDNSKSITNLNANQIVTKDYQTLINNPKIKQQFDVQDYSITNDFTPLDSLHYTGNQTDISKAIQQPQQLFKNRNKAIVLLTDGNQTTGNKYTHTPIDHNTAVYPIIYGDTTQYPDLKITQLNANRYTYLNNEYPVETFVQYYGKQPITTTFKITKGSTILHQQQLQLSPQQPAQTISVNLTSNQIGLQSLTASLSNLTDEKNTVNNTKKFAVDVIDQQTKVLILTDIIHPDLAALKSAITANQQRQVYIMSTKDDPDLNDYNMVIYYCPGYAFAKAYQQAQILNKNTLTIAGPATDFTFLNQQIKAYQITNQDDQDEVQPIINTAYQTFNTESFTYQDYPPVLSPFGTVRHNAVPDVLMYQQINDVISERPLWFTYQDGDVKHGVLLAQGFWRWRAHCYIQQQNFTQWDDLIASQIQYLSSNQKRERLSSNHESYYYQNQPIKINVHYLNKNYEFDANGVINIKLTNSTTNQSIERPVILDNNNYVVDLSGIDAGQYKYVIDVVNGNLSRSGTITILPFDIEQQFDHANDSDMLQLLGKDAVYYQGDLNKVVDQLINNSLTKPIERKTLSPSSLIDWQYLLIIICIMLGVEWLLRKYSGLI